MEEAEIRPYSTVGKPLTGQSEDSSDSKGLFVIERAITSTNHVFSLAQTNKPARLTDRYMLDSAAATFVPSEYEGVQLRIHLNGDRIQVDGAENAFVIIKVTFADIMGDFFETKSEFPELQFAWESGSGELPVKATSSHDGSSNSSNNNNNKRASDSAQPLLSAASIGGYSDTGGRFSFMYRLAHSGAHFSFSGITLSFRQVAPLIVDDAGNKSPRPLTIYSFVEGYVDITCPCDAKQDPGRVSSIVSGKKWRHRNEVVKEILSSEITYIEGLNTLIDMYMKPLTGSSNSLKPVLDGSEVTRLFSNVELLLNVNKELLMQLEERVTRWTDTTLLGDVFLRMAPFLKTYAQYCNNYPQAIQLYNEKKALNSKFAEFVRSTKELTGKMELSSFFLLPVQRVPRYKMLLEDLLKHTWDQHPDKANLDKAVRLVSEITEHINNSLGKAENIAKMLDIDRRFQGSHESFIAPYRRFVHEGELLKISSGRAARRFFFLFNDLIVYVKVQRRRFFAFKGQMDLRVCWCKNMPDTPQIKCAFYLVTTKKTYILVCKTESQKQLWIEKITEQVNHLLSLNPKLKDEQAKFVAPSKRGFLNRLRKGQGSEDGSNSDLTRSERSNSIASSFFSPGFNVLSNSNPDLSSGHDSKRNSDDLEHAHTDLTDSPRSSPQVISGSPSNTNQSELALSSMDISLSSDEEESDEEDENSKERSSSLGKAPTTLTSPSPSASSSQQTPIPSSPSQQDKSAINAAGEDKETIAKINGFQDKKLRVTTADIDMHQESATDQLPTLSRSGTMISSSNALLARPKPPSPSTVRRSTTVSPSKLRDFTYPGSMKSPTGTPGLGLISPESTKSQPNVSSAVLTGIHQRTSPPTSTKASPTGSQANISGQHSHNNGNAPSSFTRSASMARLGSNSGDSKSNNTNNTNSNNSSSSSNNNNSMMKKSESFSADSLVSSSSSPPSSSSAPISGSLTNLTRSATTSSPRSFGMGSGVSMKKGSPTSGDRPPLPVAPKPTILASSNSSSSSPPQSNTSLPSSSSPPNSSSRSSPNGSLSSRSGAPRRPIPDKPVGTEPGNQFPILDANGEMSRRISLVLSGTITKEGVTVFGKRMSQILNEKVRVLGTTDEDDNFMKETMFTEPVRVYLNKETNMFVTINLSHTALVTDALELTLQQAEIPKSEWSKYHLYEVDSALVGGQRLMNPTEEPLAVKLNWASHGNTYFLARLRDDAMAKRYKETAKRLSKKMQYNAANTPVVISRSGGQSRPHASSLFSAFTPGASPASSTSTSVSSSATPAPASAPSASPAPFPIASPASTAPSSHSESASSAASAHAAVDETDQERLKPRLQFMHLMRPPSMPPPANLTSGIPSKPGNSGTPPPVPDRGLTASSISIADRGPNSSSLLPPPQGPPPTTPLPPVPKQ